MTRYIFLYVAINVLYALSRRQESTNIGFWIYQSWTTGWDGGGGGEFNQRMGPLLRFDLATQATSGSITIKASNKGELCNH